MLCVNQGPVYMYALVIFAMEILHIYNITYEKTETTKMHFSSFDLYSFDSVVFFIISNLWFWMTDICREEHSMRVKINFWFVVPYSFSLCYRWMIIQMFSQMKLLINTLHFAHNLPGNLSTSINGLHCFQYREIPDKASTSYKAPSFY